jgi:mono/diheme cytochrome c family protein
MERHRLGATAPAEFAKSVHGRRLADGEPGVPSCADCHDAHAATPAGATEVAEVCGNCHAEPRDQFRRSPHFAASKRGRMKQCITCHGNHAIASPGYALFDAESDAADEAPGATRCLACHGSDAPGGRAAEVARKFGSELRSVDALLRDAESEVRRVSDAGFFVDDERSALAKARRALVASIPLTHSCDTVPVDAPLRRARSLANEALEGCAKRIRESRDRRIFGSAAAVLLFGVSSFLSLRRRTKGKP